MPNLMTPGHAPLPGAGRPKGSIDKRWQKLSYWADLVIHEWPDLSPKDRAFYAMEAFKALLKRSRFTSDEEYNTAIEVVASIVKEAGDKNFSNVPD